MKTKTKSKKPMEVTVAKGKLVPIKSTHQHVWIRDLKSGNKVGVTIAATDSDRSNWRWKIAWLHPPTWKDLRQCYLWQPWGKALEVYFERSEWREAAEERWDRYDRDHK